MTDLLVGWIQTSQRGENYIFMLLHQKLFAQTFANFVSFEQKPFGQKNVQLFVIRANDIWAKYVATLCN